MDAFDEPIGKIVTRRKQKEASLEDAAILLKTAAELCGPHLCPKGVFRFSSFEEADEWALKQAANPRARPS